MPATDRLINAQEVQKRTTLRDAKAARRLMRKLGATEIGSRRIMILESRLDNFLANPGRIDIRVAAQGAGWRRPQTNDLTKKKPPKAPSEAVAD